MNVREHQQALRQFAGQRIAAAHQAAPQAEEWAAAVVDHDGKIQYVAATGTRDRHNRSALFTRYRGTSARYTSENAALARAYDIKSDELPGGRRRHPWISDVRAERIR